MPKGFDPGGKLLNAAGWPSLLILCSLALPLLQAWAGIPLAGYHQAHDGRFALWTLVQFQSGMTTGAFPPRWSVQGFQGLGSPIFYFYPPGAFGLTWLLGTLSPGLSAAALLGLGQFAFRVGSTLTCLFWLRMRTDLWSASIGSALYGLMPYTAVINPQIRLAYAECAAAAVVPLVFAAIDGARGDGKRTLVLVGAATALLAIVHLPSTVLAAGLGVIYAGAGGERPLDALRRSAFAAGGVAFGLGMAAYFVIPAVTLLNEITPSALTDTDHSPETNFLLVANGFRTAHGSLHGLLLDLSLVIPSIACLATAPAALRADPRSRAILGTCLIAVLLTLPVSGFMWKHLAPLRMVQFPWRTLLILSLLASASVAVALATLNARARRIILCSAAILAAGDLAMAVKFGDGFTSASSRTLHALEAGGGDAPEYLPVDAARHGWFDAAEPGQGNLTRAAAFISKCLGNAGEAPDDNEPKFYVHDCSGTIVLPQFYFPGWVAVVGKTVLPVFPDPDSGLTSVVIEPGNGTLLLRRHMLGSETAGAAISIACMALWGVLACLIVRARRTGRSRTGRSLRDDPERAGHAPARDASR